MDDGNNEHTQGNETSDSQNERINNVLAPQSTANDGRSQSPEPPPSWKPDDNHFQVQDNNGSESDSERGAAVVGRVILKLEGEEALQFEKARKFITASQFTAIVSLFFGGMLLSSVAIVLAVLGYRGLSGIAANREGQPLVQRALKRSGLVAIGMSVLALVVNAVTLLVMYPILMQTLQEEGITGLLPGFHSGGSAMQAPSSTTLFG